MGIGEQLVTVAAVLLGALTTHLTNYVMERSRHRRELLTRWDDRKLDAYAGYIDTMRTCIFVAVQLYEHKEGLRESGKTESEMLAEQSEAGRLRGRAFEQIMLLGGDEVVEAAHELNVVALAVDWQASGKTTGTLEDWRERNRAVFREINQFHEAARVDLGVQGKVTGENHPERDLLLPTARRDGGQAGG
ncbi:hypothetical protein [Streptomyces sp. 35G-GA-8]|uniref:hypothetical protein n=1 Tax=Streptomyces sp. 35G-GA-8 TaxID=2939434 RepID=UPI00201EEE0D|nr:hypothetical protein [Streptomyces sp. 35G-GA-8]MCL7379633.1 hypothetical protein [Streptomyces sp. 35G-GA-8]